MSSTSFSPILIGSIFSTLLVISGCGGGGGSSSTAPPTSSTDPIVVGPPVVIDPLPTGQGNGSNTGNFTGVSGLAFRTENPTTSVEVTGVVGADGNFTYNNDDIVIFYLGDIEIGRTRGASNITVMNLVNAPEVDSGHPRVRDISRFLMAVDSDEYYQNGIQVANASHGAANNIDLNLADLEQGLDTTELNQVVKIISKSKGFDNPIIDTFTFYSSNAAGVFIDNSLKTKSPVVTHTTPQYFHPSTDPIYPSRNEISVKFSKPILSSSVNTSNVKLVSIDTSNVETTVPGKAFIPTGASQGTRVVFQPTNVLSDNTTYRLDVSGLTDSTNISMAQPFNFEFNTVDLTGANALAVLDASRLNNSIVTSDNSTINIRFSMFDYTGAPLEGLPLDPALSPFVFTEGADQYPIFDDIYETYQGFPDANQVESAINMHILLDNSSSMKDVDFNAYKAELTKLIATVGAPTKSNLLEGHQVNIIKFSQAQTSVTSGYSNNPLFLLEQLTSALNDGSTTTDLAGAINSSINTLGNNNQTSLNAAGNEVITQKVLVIFTDGVDTSGNTSVDLNTAYTNLLNRGIDVYLISNNTEIDPLLEIGFNKVTNAADITAGIKANIDRNIADYEKSRYHFQYASPKRFNSTVAVNASITGNLNLGSNILLGNFNPNGFQDETGILKLKNVTTNKFFNGPLNIEIGSTPDKTISTKIYSHFLPTTTQYAVTVDETALLRLANTSGVASKDNVLEGLVAGSTFITLNDTINNVVRRMPVYIGNHYKYDFENGANDTQGWVTTANWVVGTVNAEDRKNRSDGAMIFAEKINAAIPGDSMESPVIDLSRYQTSPNPDLSAGSSGLPVLKFKYKLRTNTLQDTNDHVVVELSTDGGASYPNQLIDLTAFTHDWTEIAPIDLDAFNTQSNVKIRISYISDATNTFDGFMIDDIEITPTQ